MTQYLIIIEADDNGCSAYVPDQPGSFAAGRTRDEVVTLLREAIPTHLALLRAQGVPVPTPQCTSAVIDIAA